MSGPVSGRAAALQGIKKALVAGYPIIAIETWEEDQAIQALHSFARSVFPQGSDPIIWDLQQGLRQGSASIGGQAEALDALDHIQTLKEPGFFIFKDLPNLLEDPHMQRRLRNINLNFRHQNRFLFLIGQEFQIPPSIRKDLHLIDFGLPGVEELSDLFQRNLAAAVKRGVASSLEEKDVELAVEAMKGFTAAEAQHCLNQILWNRKDLDSTILNELQEAKSQLTRKEGILEYVRVQNRMEDVGGLENLKDWLVKRKRLFSPEAIAAGIRPPRGVLMMGISGCGKSLSVKAISSLWSLPLFRLDMNQVFSGMHGNPEASFIRAIRSIEAVAPAILWIDEIEGGISSASMKDGSTGSHIFSAFLTWMQEKSNEVFVAATANRIDLLPAEIIRKGRFDQIFFVDLPNDSEREAIFRVHLKRTGNKLEDFDLPLLSVATEFWNGAEIEHVVEAAMVEAFHRGEKLAQDDLYTIIRNNVPLSRTMAEQIKFIKAWASERAVSASIKDPD